MGPAFSSRSVGWALAHVRRLGGRFGKEGEEVGSMPSLSASSGAGRERYQEAPRDRWFPILVYPISPGLGLATYTNF